MKIITLLAVAIIVSVNTYAQDQHLVDSLKTSLTSAKTDTAKAMILFEISKAFSFHDSVKAMVYAHQCRSLSEKIGYTSGIGFSYISMGNVLCARGNYDTAKEFFHNALKLFETIHNKKGIAYANQGIGAVYTFRANYNEAMQLQRSALKILQGIDDKAGIVSGLINIGIIEHLKGNYPEALKNYYRALQICEESKNYYDAAPCLSNIALVYFLQGNYEQTKQYIAKSVSLCKKYNLRGNMITNFTLQGMIFMMRGENKEAIDYYSQGASIGDSVNNLFMKAYCIGNIGFTYFNMGKYEQAILYSLDAIEMLKKSNSREAISGYYETIGQVYTKQKKYNMAEKYLKEALSISIEINALENCKDIYQSLSKLDSTRGNYEGAFGYYKKFISYRDSLQNEETAKKTVQQKMQYEFDKKEAVTKAEQEEELQKQKFIRNGFVGGFGLVFLFSILIVRQRNKVKKEKQNVEIEKDRSDNLLLNILPAEVAEELKEKGTAEAKHFDNVTVLFTDFKSFTKVSEQLSPQELVDELHACFKGFDEIITKYNIEKIKTIGDAYLAVCGLPLADEKHAKNVVHAALEIREFMEKRREKFGAKTFEIRIGINSGSVVAGIVGVKKFAYDIWGDTVNTAARMEQHSEAGKINISETTYELVKEQFTCEYRGEIDAKNKGKLAMYFVENSSL
jgi:class 3 adenylate cyclase/Tfp pilus assembly protein PilF